MPKEIEEHLVILSRHEERLKDVIELYEEKFQTDEDDAMALIISDIWLKTDGDLVRTRRIMKAARKRYAECLAHAPDKAR